MSDLADGGARVTCAKYSEVPDVQRIAFVTGMIEMFDLMLRYIGPSQQRRFETMSEFAKTVNTTAITKIFDEYLANDRERLKFAVNGTFLLALNDACGFDKARS